MYYFLLVCLLSTPLIAKEMNHLFSNSIIIIKGLNTLAVPSEDDKIRGISVSIDWDQLPNIGFPKEEIHTIQVLGRQHLNHQTNIIDLQATVWRFIAETWTTDYYGQIPYLENLEFLPEDMDLQINNHILREQNNLGYYQDKNTLYPGFYQHINNPSDNLVRCIYLVSAEENQYIYNMQKQIDVQIIADQLLSIPEQPIEIETDHIQGIVLEPTNTTTNTNEIELGKTDWSINTSIDKKKNQTNK
ncbi:MAG: hypothetical protein ACRC0X_06405 [Brevinema sp.]